MNEPQIILPISKFKEILLNSWDLIPENKKHELIAMGVFPTSRSPSD